MEDQDSTIPIVSGEELRQLNGRRWKIHGIDYVISSGTTGIDHTSMSGGTESRIIPLLDESGAVAWRFKTYLKPVSAQRVIRNRWLCRQRVRDWSPGLAGAPREWIDTRVCGRPEGADVDFAGYLMSDIPGLTWAELRLSVVHDGIRIQDEWRQRWISQLLRTLVALENHNLIHGDLSPGNVVLTYEHPLSLTLIDFDTFVSLDSEREAAPLSGSDGGMIGTAGYMPIDLERRRNETHGSSPLTPYSDRRARDMLLLELFCFDDRCPEEDPVADWEWELVDEILEKRELRQAERYFRREQIIDLPESSRVSSAALARAFGLSLAPTVRKSTTIVRDDATVPRNQSQSGWNRAIYSLSIVERARAAIKSILWSVCVAEWIMLSMMLPRHIIPLDEHPGWALWLISIPVRFLVGATILTTGLLQTTTAANESEVATRFQIGRYQFVIPKAPHWRGSAHHWCQSPIIRLCVGAVLLAGAVLGVSRMSQV